MSMGYQTLPGLHPKEACTSRTVQKTHYGTYRKTRPSIRSCSTASEEWETAKKPCAREIVDPTRGQRHRPRLYWQSRWCHPPHWRF